MALLPTSGTYNFQSIQVELLIREAFENIGIFGEFVESQKLDSAKRIIDLLMLEWMSKSVNLWTLEYDYMSLVTSQAQYTLPEPISDIVQINLRTSTRQLNGTATSSNGGDAANAFDGNPATFCNAGADGNISYNYGNGNTQQINFIGISPNTDIIVTSVAQLLIQTSPDGATWTTILTIPIGTYFAANTYWFDILTPIQSQYYQIISTGGLTLSLIELYFNNNVYDMPISEVSREEYFTYPNKQLQGRPSIYYINRLIVPVLYIWPVPSSYYTCMQVSYKEMIQDAGNYTNTLQIPARFYPALVNGLSWKLAIKFNPQSAQMFQAEYEKSFNIATIEDSENEPIKISGGKY